MLDVREDRDEGADILGEGKEAKPDLRDDADRALAADDERDAVVPRQVRDLAAEAHGLARRHNELDSEHVIGHRPVPQGVRTTRVRRDVPTDRRDALARRVGSEKESVLLCRDAYGEIGNARLDHGETPDRIDRNDPSKPRG